MKQIMCWSHYYFQDPLSKEDIVFFFYNAPKKYLRMELSAFWELEFVLIV